MLEMLLLLIQWDMPLQPLLKPVNLRLDFSVLSRVSKADVNSSEAYPTSLYSKFHEDKLLSSPASKRLAFCVLRGSRAAYPASIAQPEGGIKQ